MRDAGFTIRGAGPEDAEAVGALLRASYPPLMAAGYPADVLERALPAMMKANPLLLRSGTYHLAVADDGAVIGCGGWTREPPGPPCQPVDPKVGHIRHFATHPDFLRRGVGSALLGRCIAEAGVVGVRRLECLSSLVAERFYASAGFHPLGKRSVILAPGVQFDSVVMALELSPPAG
ncbi:MAG: GNAT family N-acetyltransferase [Alphaproteobacteria bacterium]